MARVQKLDIEIGMQAKAASDTAKKLTNDLMAVYGITQKNASSIVKLEERMKFAAATFDMSANQVAIYKLELAGVPSKALEAAKAADQLIENLKKEKKASEESARNWANLKNQILPALTVFSAAKIGVSLVSSAFHALTSGISAATDAVVSYLQNQIMVMDNSGDFSGVLGLAVEDLTRLQWAFKLAGAQSEDVGPALSKFSINLSDAARKGGPMADALKAIGLNAKALQQQSLTETVFDLSDAFQKVKNPIDRAGLAMDLFGKQGVVILNALNAGSGELRRFAKESDDLGNTVKAEWASLAGDANDFIDRLKATFGGFGNQVLSQILPPILKLGEEIVALSGSLTKAAEDSGAALMVVKVGVASVGLAIDAVKFGFNELLAVFSGVASSMIGKVELVAKGFEYLVNLMPGVNAKFSEGITSIREQLDRWNSSAKFAAGSAVASGLDRVFGEVKEGANGAAGALAKQVKATSDLDLANFDLAEKLKATTDELKKAIATHGQAGGDKLFDLKAAGADDNQLAIVKSLQEQLSLLEEQKKAREDIAKGQEKFYEDQQSAAKKYKESLLNPVDTLKKQVAEVNELTNSGFLMGSEGADSKRKLLGDFAKGLKGDSKQADKFGGAFNQGSMEARNVILANSGGRTNDLQSRMVKALEDMLKKDDKSIDLLGQLLNKKDPTFAL